MQAVIQDLRVRVHQVQVMSEDHQAVLTREVQVVHPVLQEVVAPIQHLQEAVHREPIQHLRGAVLQVAQADRTQVAEAVAEAAAAADLDADDNGNFFHNLTLLKSKK